MRLERSFTALMPRISFRFALVTFITLASPGLRAQTVDAIDSALRSQVDRIASQVLEATGVPSASVAVVQHGKLVYTHAYGNARVATAASAAVPATPEMRYSIGSISKQFTATAILLLQEQGKLSIDDPVGKYIPGLTRGNEVTIREILSHTSGYQDYWPEDYVMTTMMGPETAQQIIDTWAKKPLDFEPGTEWQYSNTNFVIAGCIVEVVSGENSVGFSERAHLSAFGHEVGLEFRSKRTRRSGCHAVRSQCAGTSARCPERGHWLDVRGGRTGHDCARPGAVG